MMSIKDKLQNIGDKLQILLSQLKRICVKNIASIPIQIDKIIVGINKLPLYLDRTLYEIDENDLNGVAKIEGFTEFGSLTSVTIPDSVTSIGIAAFENCTSLESVAIGNGVTSINIFAFYGCTNLTDIYLNPTIPPSLGDTDAIPDYTTIHVPIGSGDAYKSATNWSYHSDRIVEDIEI